MNPFNGDILTWVDVTRKTLYRLPICSDTTASKPPLIMVKFKVAICGGGIGGLTLAVAISNYPDIEVEIYEAASNLTQVGAGIGVFQRTWEILQKLGLDKELLKTTDVKRTDGLGAFVTTFRFRKSDQSEGMDFYELITRGNMMTFHRADFQQVLLDKLSSTSCRIFCGKRLSSYVQPVWGPTTLSFEDGTKASCDVLIGADGIKSAVRHSLLKEMANKSQSEGRCSEASELMASIDPVWSGMIAYRALIPTDQLKAQKADHPIFSQPIQYLGKDGFIIAYPISCGKFINFVAFQAHRELENTKFSGPWVSTAETSEFRNHFKKWEPQVQALLDCVDKPLRWAIHTVKPLKSFVSGRVCLLGDAGHAMTPFQGAGAGQAIEDAYILATILGHAGTTRDNIAHGLSIYDRIRRPFAQGVQERSWRNGQFFSMQYNRGDYSSLSRNELKHKLRLPALKSAKDWEWAWMSSIDSLVNETQRLLKAEGLAPLRDESRL